MVHNIRNPTIHHNFLIGSEKRIPKNFPTITELNTLIEKTSVSWNLHVNYKKNAHELVWMNVTFHNAENVKSNARSKFQKKFRNLKKFSG